MFRSRILLFTFRLLHLFLFPLKLLLTLQDAMPATLEWQLRHLSLYPVRISHSTSMEVVEQTATKLKLREPISTSTLLAVNVAAAVLITVAFLLGYQQYGIPGAITLSVFILSFFIPSTYLSTLCSLLSMISLGLLKFKGISGFIYGVVLGGVLWLCVYATRGCIGGWRWLTVTCIFDKVFNRFEIRKLGVFGIKTESYVLDTVVKPELTDIIEQYGVHPDVYDKRFLSGISIVLVTGRRVPITLGYVNSELRFSNRTRRLEDGAYHNEGADYHRSVRWDISLNACQQAEQICRAISQFLAS